MKTDIEVLRSTFTADGQRLSLNYIQATSQYAVATPWQWLVKCEKLNDAIAAYEVLEFCEGDLKKQVPVLKKELGRVKKNSICGGAMARTNYILDCMERRSLGLRPVFTGSKGSVVQ